MDNPLLNDDTELFFFADGKKDGFKTPAAANYERYIEHIDTTMPPDTPIAFGLHPNAEIGFRTA
jgi:dynein heavy chain